MATLYTHKDENIAKTWVLMFVFLCVVIGIGWAVSFYFNSPVILPIAIVSRRLDEHLELLVLGQNS
jgi:hypothetical protein